MGAIEEAWDFNESPRILRHRIGTIPIRPIGVQERHIAIGQIKAFGAHLENGPYNLDIQRFIFWERSKVNPIELAQHVLNIGLYFCLSFGRAVGQP